MVKNAVMFADLVLPEYEPWISEEYWPILTNSLEQVPALVAFYTDVNNGRVGRLQQSVNRGRASKAAWGTINGKIYAVF